MSLKSFIQESKQEFARINWPTRRETVRMVGIVFSISVFMALFLGALDYGFLLGIGEVLSR